MKQAVVVEVAGEAGKRYSVRCKCCKTRWTEEHADSEIYRGTMRETIGRAHSCPKVDEWKKVHPYTTVAMSAFVMDVVRWGRRADGTTTKCDGRCMGAKGFDCDCHCKGQNHGKGWSGAIELDRVDEFIKKDLDSVRTHA
jgi:hypothetical protein